jgi:hypothetical protein
LAGASKIYSTLFSGIYTPPMLHITITFVKSKKLKKATTLPILAMQALSGEQV